MIPRAFALSLQSRPATKGSAPSLGTDGYPRPPESVLARHSRGRRIDRLGLPQTGQLSLCPTSGSPLEAPPHWTGHGDHKSGSARGDNYPHGGLKI